MLQMGPDKTKGKAPSQRLLRGRSVGELNSFMISLRRILNVALHLNMACFHLEKILPFPVALRSSLLASISDSSPLQPSSLPVPFFSLSPGIVIRRMA